MTNLIARQNRFRFTLRTLFLLTAIVGLVLWAVPTSIEWYKWHLIHKEIAKNFVDLHVTPSKTTVVWLSTGTQGFFLSNRVIEWAGGNVNGVNPVDAPVERESIYVLPPGKWAKSPEDVVGILRMSH